GQMLATHVHNKADMTVACVNVPLDEANGFGIIGVDGEDRVVEFQEKPDRPNPLPDDSSQALASMGIYVFNASFLYEQLTRDAADEHSKHDFGHDLIPYMIGKYRIYAHRFTESCVNATDGNYYWRDVGTVDAYWEANMELTKVVPELNLYDSSWPIWTYQEQLPPAKFVFDDADRCGRAIDSLVSGGCIISGCSIKNSVLFSDVRVNSYSEIQNSVILPKVDIGRHVTLKRVIVDKGTRIPDGMQVGVDPNEDRKRFCVTEKGITLVTPEMLGQSSHMVR
ncbi:MAG TPA: sugar phosphate nucleotidyltransferase, partial [Methylophilaceae bacterium]|nr:sugar phosphate nucleotidyltransferase [Methylophilaceae bacterium]